MGALNASAPDYVWRAGDGPQVLNYTIQTAAGAAYNLAGTSIRWALSPYVPSGRFGAAALITKSIGSGITVTDASGGLCTVTVTAADLTQTPALAGLHRFEMEVVSGSTRDTVDEGLVQILPELLKAP